LATLFINDFYYGVMVIVERIDEKFMKSRFGVSDINLYKSQGGFYLNYWGSTPKPYQDFTMSEFDNSPINPLSQYKGDGDWSDFVLLTTVLNSTSMAIPYLQQQFNQEAFIRASAVSLAMDNFDCYYGDGNNYMLANTGSEAYPKWEWVSFDFDSAFTSPYGLAAFFGMTPAQLEALIESGVTGLGGIQFADYIFNPNPYLVIDKPARPLANAIYAQDGMNDTFTNIYTDLWQRFIFNKPGTVQARRTAYYNLIRPFIYRDRMYTMPVLFESAPTYAVDFELAYNTSTPQWMNEKFSAMGSLFVANGHGTCDALGKCTCKQHYSGPTCQTYKKN